MRTKRVIVEKHNPAWKDEFGKIQSEILEAAGDLIVRIEHVGSTSVEGLSAKPCIDLDVVIEDDSLLGLMIERLASIGYIHEGNLGIPGREAFRYSNKPHLMAHHLYVCPKDSAELHRHVVFRDFLRLHPEEARRYGTIKEQAAQLFPDDIEKFIAYKTPCIEELYAMCGLK